MKTDNMAIDEAHEILTGNIPQKQGRPTRGKKWNPITCKLEDDFLPTAPLTSLQIPESGVKGGEIKI